jgi:hypothetical protein
LLFDYSSSANNRHSVWEEELEATDCSSPPDKLEDDGELDGEVGKRLNDMVATPVSLFLPSSNFFYFLTCAYKFLLHMYTQLRCIGNGIHMVDSMLRSLSDK